MRNGYDTTVTAFGSLIDVYFFHQNHATQVYSPYLGAKSAFFRNLTRTWVLNESQSHAGSNDDSKGRTGVSIMRSELHLKR